MNELVRSNQRLDMLIGGLQELAGKLTDSGLYENGISHASVYATIVHEAIEQLTAKRSGVETEPEQQRNWAIWHCMRHKRLFAAHAGCSLCRTDPDPSNSGAPPQVKATDECCLNDPGGGLVCTLPKDHIGPHEAWGTRNNLLQAWSAENGT